MQKILKVFPNKAELEYRFKKDCAFYSLSTDVKLYKTDKRIVIADELEFVYVDVNNIAKVRGCKIEAIWYDEYSGLVPENAEEAENET